MKPGEATTYDEQRDTVIKRARDITKASKVAIYACTAAIAKADVIASVAAVADELLPSSQPTRPRAGVHGWARGAAEAVVFAHFGTRRSQGIDPDLARCDRDEYLGGALDFTGELNRFPWQATVGDVEAVKKCREIVDALWASSPSRLSQRVPAEEVRRVENTLYEMSLTSAAAKRSREDAGLDDDVGPKGGDGGDE